MLDLASAEQYRSWICSGFLNGNGGVCLACLRAWPLLNLVWNGREEDFEKREEMGEEVGPALKEEENKVATTRNSSIQLCPILLGWFC